MLKKPKQGIVFSSEDSQSTDFSMESSVDMKDPSAEQSENNKFEKLKEQMNQLFLANPELMDNLKFERMEEFEDEKPQNVKANQSPRGSPMSKGRSTVDFANSMVDEYDSEKEVTNDKTGSGSKFWSFISKEMTKLPKQSNIPPLKVINHRLNIFKVKFEQPELIDTPIARMSSPPPGLKDEKTKFSNPNLAKGKSPTNLSRPKEYNKDNNKDNNEFIELGNPDDADDGLMYYSFKKRMNLKIKKQRDVKSMKSLSMKEHPMGKLKEFSENMVSDTNFNMLTQGTSHRGQSPPFQVNPSGSTFRDVQARADAIKSIYDENSKGQKGVSSAKNSELSTDRNQMKYRKDGTKLRAQSGKPSNIIERLTKDFIPQPKKVEEEDDPRKKKNFLTGLAEQMYKDLKELGETEAFKRVAQGKIKQFKKDFKDKVHKYRTYPPETIKFTKSNYKKYNLYVPNWSLGSAIQNKEAVLTANELNKNSPEFKEQPENEIWWKMNKILNGNMINFWKMTDFNQ